MAQDKTKEVYTVAEFAKLAGVSVRTLHYYDEIGLLQPERRATQSQAGTRLYRRHDLVRLQQIVTLKWMGFDLDTIGAILRAPDFDLNAALDTQKGALQKQVERLQAAISALERAQSVLESTGNADLDALNTVIHAVNAPVITPDPNRIMRHYSDHAAQVLATRAKALPPEVMEDAPRRWAEVSACFEALIDFPTDDPAVQACAAQMHLLIEAFTGGDAEVLGGLTQAMANVQEFPPEHRPYGDNDLRQFMTTAYALYRQRLEG